MSSESEIVRLVEQQEEGLLTEVPALQTTIVVLSKVNNS
eukprot:COSAG06_NODE_1952_length_7992_cov_4.274294_1_plen_39_part_00